MLWKLLTAILTLGVLTICGLSQTAADEDRKEAAQLAALEKSQVAAKSAFVKSPKDPKAKAAYIKSSNKLAYTAMNALTLPPRVKYPKALRLYRDVLKVDPKNAEALKWKKQIEDIYRSMGRPIPK